MVDAVHDLMPARDVGPRKIVDPEGAKHFVIEPAS